MFAVKQQTGFFRSMVLLAVAGLLTINTASALTGQPADYSPAELEELVGPVALYPDDLVAIILPASSYPLQIVAAFRYLAELENNPDLKPDEDWDDSVVALLNYPEVIELLNEDLDWTWNLGEAVVNQQADVLAAIQTFRGRAVAAGNFKTDDRQTVSHVDNVIEVTPVDPEVIYVPYYEPRLVVRYQRRPVYRYYPEPYPVYYYPYPIHYRFSSGFSSGFFWGVTTAYTIGWLTDRLHFHYSGYSSHPYYGRHYTSHYYSPFAGRIRHRHITRSRGNFANSRHRYGNTWRPGHRHGNRPGPRVARTNHRQPGASSFRGSAPRRNRASDARIRTNADRQTRARFRAGQQRANVQSRPAGDRVRDQNVSTRRSLRRPNNGARTNTRAAVVDRSGNGNSSRRVRTPNPRSGSNRAVTNRNARSANAVRTARATPSRNSFASSSRRTSTRAPARQTQSAGTAPSRSTPSARSSRSTNERVQSRSGRSGNRGGHRR